MPSPILHRPDFAALIGDTQNRDLNDWADVPAVTPARNPFMAVLQDTEARCARDWGVLFPRIERDALLAMSEDLPNSYRVDAALRVFVSCAVLAATEIGDPDIAEFEAALDNWRGACNRPAKRLRACRVYFLSILASPCIANLAPRASDVWLPLERHLAARTTGDWNILLQTCLSLHEALERPDGPDHVRSAAAYVASVMDVPLRPAARRR